MNTWELFAAAALMGNIGNIRSYETACEVAGKYADTMIKERFKRASTMKDHPITASDRTAEQDQSIVRDDWKEMRQRAERDCVIADLTRYLNERDELLKRARKTIMIARELLCDWDDPKVNELLEDIDNVINTEGQ